MEGEPSASHWGVQEEFCSLSGSGSFSVGSTGPVSATARWAAAATATPTTAMAMTGATATAQATVVVAVIAGGVGNGRIHGGAGGQFPLSVDTHSGPSPWWAGQTTGRGWALFHFHLRPFGVCTALGDRPASLTTLCCRVGAPATKAEKPAPSGTPPAGAAVRGGL